MLLTKELPNQRFRRLWALLGELDAFACLPKGAVSRDGRFATVWLPRIEVLAKLDVEALVPIRARWPDPALAPLVVRLTPIWCRVTGRSADLTQDDKAGDTKKCLFAKWLGDLFADMDLQRPPVGRVVDIVRSICN